MIGALIFDMDGLLFDSERIVQRSWEDCGNVLGIPRMGSHIYHTLGMNAVSRKEYFSQAVGADFPHEEFAALTRVRFREITDEEGLPMKPGVKELLLYARSHGLKTAVATSSRGEYALRNLTDAGIKGYFDGFVFGDMVSRAKPDPEIYLSACMAIGADAGRCMALEDSPNGIRSAHAAGMVPVMVPDLVRPDEALTRLTYKVVETLHEVPALLEAFNGGLVN